MVVVVSCAFSDMCFQRPTTGVSASVGRAGVTCPFTTARQYSTSLRWTRVLLPPGAVPAPAPGKFHETTTGMPRVWAVWFKKNFSAWIYHHHHQLHQLQANKPTKPNDPPRRWDMARDASSRPASAPGPCTRVVDAPVPPLVQHVAMATSPMAACWSPTHTMREWWRERMRMNACCCVMLPPDADGADDGKGMQ
jgi:hypothetical protein